MNKNTYSLLGGNWMFTENSKTAMMPFILQIINGQTVGFADTLPPTTHYFQAEDGIITSSDQHNPLAEINSVAVLDIHHPIFKYNQECGPRGTQSIMTQLKAWEAESSIAGVVLNVNSGGGQVSGTAEFAEFISTYSKPIEVFTKDSIGSAAYYFSSGANKITAHKHADVIGSIGVMFSSVNLEGIIKKKGGEVLEVYSDLSPEKNKASRALKSGDERPLIEQHLNPMADKFRNTMKQYRPGISERALKGDVFSPEEALNEGLIDAIGTLDSVISSVFEASKSKNKRVNSNLKNKLMSKLNVPKIEAAIGSTFTEGETENGIILTDAQAEAIEQTLTSNEAAAVILDGKVMAGVTRITALEAAGNAVTETVQAALTKAEVEAADKMDNEQGIKALSDLVTEYGGNDGAVLTGTFNNGDDTVFESSITKKLNKYLNNI
tara:strand:+ start:2438 stop:3748 length:1311 start_codon:yes stop_codon:yes gene_type:complete